MAAHAEITHKGKIIDITPAVTTVEIVSESACASCHAASLCTLSEAKRKIIEVPTTVGNWEPGQEVQVCLKRSMGFKAVWVAYVIPLFVMMAVLLTLIQTGASELVAGIAAIGSVLLYYLVVFLMRDRLRNEYSFYIQ